MTTASTPRRRATRHGAISLLVAALAAVAGPPAHAQSSGARAERPNILWIIAEDIGPDLGIDGTPEVRTPNLDRLSAQGMRFTRAFATAPVCSASRSAFNTGMYQTTIGAHNHRSHREGDGTVYPFPLPEGVRTISDWMRGAGYFTGNIVDLPDHLGFDGKGKTDLNFSYDGKLFDTDRWDELKGRQPFYAQINLPETHRGPDWDEAHRRIFYRADPAKVVVPPYFPDHPVIRQDWAQYLNTLMSLDRKVGKILEQLERDGLAEKTVVVFMGDNGRAMLRNKQWPYDGGHHVPLIIRWPTGLPAPASYTAGTVSGSLLSLIDLTATSLAFAGVPKPEKMQGRVFLGASREAPREYVFGGRDRGDESVDRVRSVRSERFRYMRNYYPERPSFPNHRVKKTMYPAYWVLRKLQGEGKLTPQQARLLAPTRAPEELYDLSVDPHEMNNLAASPEHQKVLREMRAALDRWVVETDDQGRFPEPASAIRFYEERAKRLYDDRIEALRKQWGIR